MHEYLYGGFLLVDS